MSSPTASFTIRVAVVEALLSGEPRDGLNEQIDGERLWKHGRRPELVELLQCQFVGSANDDSRSGILVLNASYPGACEFVRVRTDANEIGDHDVGSRVNRRAIQSIHERELIALIAQHLADEVSYVAVVLDDQDLGNAQTVGDGGPGLQF